MLNLSAVLAFTIIIAAPASRSNPVRNPGKSPSFTPTSCCNFTGLHASLLTLRACRQERHQMVDVG